MHPIPRRLLMRHLHHRGAGAVALVVAGGVIGAAGAAAPLEHAIPAVNSDTFGAIVRNILASAVTSWAIWRLDVLLQLRHWMFHVLLREL